MAKDETAATPKAMHRATMDQMAHDQMKKLVNEALKEAYDPKPKKAGGAGPEPCCPYDDQSRIVENGMSDDRVTFEQKGKTFSQGFEITGGKANLLGSRQQVMITWTPVPGAKAEGETESVESGETEAQPEEKKEA